MRWGEFCRRLGCCCAAAVVAVGIGWVPAHAGPAGGAGLTDGTATIVVGADQSWSVTLSGRITAGGQTYAGTAASGPVFPFNSAQNTYGFPITGTSSTGSITGSCNGTLNGVNVSPAPPDGVLDEVCQLSINGATAAPLALLLVMGPTASPTTFRGVFAATPDLAAQRPVRVASFGSAAATVSYTSGLGLPNEMTFSFEGEISFGGHTYRGSASGQTPFTAANAIPAFSLTGTSPTGTLSATCSGQFDDADSQAAVSMLNCAGSVDGGANANAVLISLYQVTAHSGEFGSLTDYSGIFAGT